MTNTTLAVTTIPITAIVLTHNEAKNIAPCLNAMVRIDDVVLLDSGSADTTIEEARRARPNVRIFTNPFIDFGDQRNWALDHCGSRHEWIVFVDADEYCTPEFLDELMEFISSPRETVGAFVAGKNYFLNRWLKHSTLYPSYQLRVLKLGNVRFKRDGHGQVHVTDGALAQFKTGWIHNAFSKGVAEWVARHNRYSSTDLNLILELRRKPMDWSGLVVGGGKRRRRAMKQLSTRLPLRPAFTFVFLYFVRGGFLDGRPGLIYCLLMMSHHIHIMAKLAELKATAQPSQA